MLINHSANSSLHVYFASRATRRNKPECLTNFQTPFATWLAAKLTIIKKYRNSVATFPIAILEPPDPTPRDNPVRTSEQERTRSGKPTNGRKAMQPTSRERVHRWGRIERPFSNSSHFLIFLCPPKRSP